MCLTGGMMLSFSTYQTFYDSSNCHAKMVHILYMGILPYVLFHIGVTAKHGITCHVALFHQHHHSNIHENPFTLLK